MSSEKAEQRHKLCCKSQAKGQNRYVLAETLHLRSIDIS